MGNARLIRMAAALGLALSVLLAAAEAGAVLMTTRDWPVLELAETGTTYFTFAGSALGKGLGLLSLLLDAGGKALFWIALWRLGSRLDGALSDLKIALAFRRLALALGG